eukprot:8268-Pelagomonas_calceolata.AAC.8
MCACCARVYRCQGTKVQSPGKKGTLPAIIGLQKAIPAVTDISDKQLIYLPEASLNEGLSGAERGLPTLAHLWQGISGSGKIEGGFSACAIP